MTKIYLIRHCEAMGNVQRLFQGVTDTDISDIGAEQLEYLHRRFQDVHLDRIYSSPLLRARKTAEAVARGKGLSVEILPGLIELDGGEVENKPFRETFLAKPHLADIWTNHPEDFHPEGGESMRHAYERIWEAVLFMARENPNKTVAAALHGGVLRCLNCRLLKGDISFLKEMNWVDNTAVSLVEFDEDLNPTMQYYNDHSHLPEELIPKRSRFSMRDAAMEMQEEQQ